MKTIITQYHGPTNTRGAYISAKDGDGHRARIGYDELTNHELGEPRHRAAALKLCEKMGWKGGASLVGGWVKRDSYAFTFPDPTTARMRDALDRIAHNASLNAIDMATLARAALKPTN